MSDFRAPVGQQMLVRFVSCARSILVVLMRAHAETNMATSYIGVVMYQTTLNEQKYIATFNSLKGC
jgi:hypothetical protein